MFPGVVLRMSDQMVVLGLDRSNGNFTKLFSKIQDVQEHFKTLDVKKLTRILFQATPERGLCISNFVPL